MACYFYGECKYQIKDFKNFHFNFIEDRAYTVSPDSYLLDTKDEQGRNMCIVAIYGNLIHPNEYIMGDIFMQSQYVILDYENSRFAINGAYRLVEALDDKPERDSGSGNMTLVIIAVIVGILILVAVIGCIIVRAKNRRLQENLAKYEQL